MEKGALSMKKRLFIALNLPLQARQILESCIITLQEQNRHIKVNPVRRVFYSRCPPLSKKTRFSTDPSNGVKWVETENIHLTLHFLGYIEEDRVGEVQEILKQGCKNIPLLQVELGELGGFPNARRPKVIWVKLKEKSGGLLKLYLQLKQGLMNRGYEVDLRPFKPHITLGRVKVPQARPNFRSAKTSVGQVFKGLDESVVNHQFTVHSIELMESKLSPKGPNYTILCQQYLE